MSYVKPNDWAEDFADENGNYVNECATCKNMFRGHKRRVTCKTCTLNGPPKQEAQQAQTIEKRPKMRSEKVEAPKSRAVFYAILWPSMRKAAIDIGWALALHGSLENDMDIMGMPWTENCKPHQELAKAISDCLGDTIWREHHLTPHFTKPHGRIVYTLSIGGSWHVDLSIMPP